MFSYLLVLALSYLQAGAAVQQFDSAIAATFKEDGITLVALEVKPENAGKIIDLQHFCDRDSRCAFKDSPTVVLIATPIENSVAYINIVK